MYILFNEKKTPETFTFVLSGNKIKDAPSFPQLLNMELKVILGIQLEVYYLEKQR